MNDAIIAVIGVIIGSIMTFLFNLIKDERQWNRERKLEEERRAHEAQEARRRHIQDIYHNCIHLLATLSGPSTMTVRSTTLFEEGRGGDVRDTQKWLVSLTDHLEQNSIVPQPSFYRALDEFTARPTSGHAGVLLEEVRLIARRDKVLYPESLLEEDVRKYQIRVLIDEGYLKQQLEDHSRTLSHYYDFVCPLSDFTPSQRQILTQLYGSKVPAQITLSLPNYDKNLKKFYFFGNRAWKASFDPALVSKEELFARWEHAYNEVLEEGNRHIEESQKTSKDSSEM